MSAPSSAEVLLESEPAGAPDIVPELTRLALASA